MKIYNTKTEPATTDAATSRLGWGPIAAIVVVLGLYVAAQLAGSLVISIYPRAHHWSHAHAADWISKSIYGQFWYVLLVEILTVGGILWFIRFRKGNLGQIGLSKPRLEDIGYALRGFLIYLIAYVVIYGAITKLVPQINVNQQQDVGFNNPHGGAALLMTFMSLVLLPPLAEEIIFRGFLYTGLRRALPFAAAAIITSLLFASAHLLESAGGGLLWIAGIDTFILSMVLVYTRQKSGRLYGGMLIHATKNALAFLVLYHSMFGIL